MAYCSDFYLHLDPEGRTYARVDALDRPRAELNLDKIQRLRNRGLSLRQIASQERLSLTTVVRALKSVA
jgi:DNA invertase Pin-like site-specific DNA recombinase